MAISIWRDVHICEWISHLQPRVKCILVLSLQLYTLKSELKHVFL